MKSFLFLPFVLLIIAVFSSRAATATQTSTRAEEQTPSSQIDLFHSGEWQFSAFGEAGQGNLASKSSRFVTYQNKAIIARSVVAYIIHQPLPVIPIFRTVTIKSTKSIVKIYNSHQRNAGGGGVSSQYFLTKNWGMQIESDFLGGTNYSTSVTANLLYRYPFEFDSKPGSARGESLPARPTWGIAPYILGGGGGQWDGHAAGIGDIGAGVELRWSQHCGCFIEGRWIIHDAHQSYAAETAGLTYSF